jgi:Mor family transcriptional regulator
MMEDLTKPKPKMTLERATRIREARKAGMGWLELSKQFRVSQTTLMAVLKGTHRIFQSEVSDGPN